VSCCGVIGGLILHVLREDGSEVPWRPRVDESIIPSELRKLSSYVTVQPAHTFGVVRSDRLSALVDSPGTYRIFVEYLSPLPRNYANVQNLWTRDRGAIRSPEVELTVPLNGSCVNLTREHIKATRGRMNLG